MGDSLLLVEKNCYDNIVLVYYERRFIVEKYKENGGISYIFVTNYEYKRDGTKCIKN